MTRADWEAFVERFRDLDLEWNQSRGQAERRSHCAQSQMKLVSEAATKLPARGEVVKLVETALLDADIESIEHQFAVAVLVRRYQFPRRFLPAFVRAAVRHGTRGYRMIESVASAYPADDVVRELITIAKTNGLDEGVADFFLYYIASRTDANLVADLHVLTTKRAPYR